MAYFFSKNVNYLREKRGLTQSDAATALDIKRSTYANYENGDTEPKFEILDRFVRFFGISAQDLLFSDLSEIGDVYPNEELRDNEKTGKSIPNCIPNSIPNEENLKYERIQMSNSINKVGSKNLEMLVSIQDGMIGTQKETINTQKETINSQKELISFLNQQLAKITEENERLKRAIPEINQDMESGSGSSEQAKIA